MRGSSLPAQALTTLANRLASDRAATGSAILMTPADADERAAVKDGAWRQRSEQLATYEPYASSPEAFAGLDDGIRGVCSLADDIVVATREGDVATVSAFLTDQTLPPGDQISVMLDTEASHAAEGSDELNDSSAKDARSAFLVDGGQGLRGGQRPGGCGGCGGRRTPRLRRWPRTPASRPRLRPGPRTT